MAQVAFAIESEAPPSTENKSNVSSRIQSESQSRAESSAAGSRPQSAAVKSASQSQSESRAQSLAASNKSSVVQSRAESRIPGAQYGGSLNPMSSDRAFEKSLLDEVGVFGRGIYGTGTRL